MIYKDIEEMKRKAEAGELDAIVQLGISYLYGYGVEVDYVQAFIYLQDAAIVNNGEAQLHLGYMYENGWGIKPDLWTAYSLYRRAYKQKADGARKALGKCVDKIVDELPVTGQLTISDDFHITVCCTRFKEHMRMGKIIPFEDDDESNFYLANMNRSVKINKCPFCLEGVQHI